MRIPIIFMLIYIALNAMTMQELSKKAELQSKCVSLTKLECKSIKSRCKNEYCETFLGTCLKKINYDYSSVPSSKKIKKYLKNNQKCTSCVVTITELNIRKNPNKYEKNIIGTVKQGDKVCIYGFSGKWGKTDQGWISGKYLAPIDKTSTYSRKVEKKKFQSNKTSSKNPSADDLTLRFSDATHDIGTPATYIRFGGYSTPECKFAISNDGNNLYFTKVQSTCSKTTNSKGFKIVCNSNKSVCKTYGEFIKHIRDKQAIRNAEKYLRPKSKDVDQNKILKPEKSKIVDKVKARHILVGTENEALMIIDMLQNSNEIKKDFAKFAKKYSNGPSGKKGGDLGWINKGKMIPVFEKAAFSIGKGELSKSPVKTQFGWHVIYVEDVKYKHESKGYIREEKENLVSKNNSTSHVGTDYFVLKTLNGLTLNLEITVIENEGRMSFEQYKGKIIFIVFFGGSDWSLTTLENLVKLQEKHKKDIVVLGIPSHIMELHEETMSIFKNRLEGNCPIISMNVGKKNLVNFIMNKTGWNESTPYTIVIDANSTVQLMHLGALKEKEVEEVYNQIK